MDPEAGFPQTDAGGRENVNNRMKGRQGKWKMRRQKLQNFGAVHVRK